MIIQDHCGDLTANENVRRKLSATYTAQTTGPADLTIYNWKVGPYSALNVSFIDNIRIHPATKTFEAVPRELSTTYGGTSKLSLFAGPAHAGKSYLILAGVSGTWPGFPVSGHQVPLNLDTWTVPILGLVNTSVFVNFQGTLDAAGEAQAKLIAKGNLGMEMLGQALHLVYLVTDQAWTLPVMEVSHPAYVYFIP